MSVGRTSAFIAAGCSHVIAFGGSPSSANDGLLPPLPPRNFWHIIAALRDVLLVIDELVVDRLFEISGPCAELRQTVDHILAQVQTIKLVHDNHIKRRGRGAFLLVTANVDVLMIGPPVSKPMNEPWVPVKCEDNRLIFREQRVEVVIRKSVWM